MSALPNYTIQEWLFNEAEGRFDIDLAESGIQYRYLHDLDLSRNYDLNYSIDRGQFAVREQIARLYQVNLNQVMITNGSQEALYLFYNCLLGAHDHVITFSPGWQQSWEVPNRLTGNVTVLPLESSTNYQIDLNQIESAIRKNTKLIILNSPNNPIGTQISKKNLQQLIELCHKKNIFLINDEEYLTNYAHSVVSLGEKTASVASLSKVYGFPGLRLGWFVGPADLVEQMVNYKRYVTVTNSSLCEYLGLQVLQKAEHYLAQFDQMIQEKLPIIKSIITKYPGLQMICPENTPYAYIRMADQDSWAFSRSLLTAERVLVMPAEVFASQHAIRVSFVREETVLREGLERLARHFISFCSTYIKEANVV